MPIRNRHTNMANLQNKLLFSTLIASTVMSMPVYSEDQIKTKQNTQSIQHDVIDFKAEKVREISAEIKPIVYNFNQLGFNNSIHIQGSGDVAYVGFGSRLDEVASNINVHLQFTPSPALIAVKSHLKVYFNDQLAGVIAIKNGSQGNKMEANIPLDPRLFNNYNQLKFELIGNINESCNNPNSGSLWLDIDSTHSQVSFNAQKTLIRNDLALLPAPFFDERDMGNISLPMVFGEKIDLNEIKAAGIASSYFSSLAKWRKTDFPVFDNKLPEKHAIVFMTNTNKPSFLKDFPDSKGPQLQVISHPTKPYQKLLIVSGRNSQDLIKATEGLAFGQHLLTGPIAYIDNVQSVEPRKPYDAPNWIRTDQPILLSELVEDKNNLQSEGQNPPPMTVKFRLPPDLFTWQMKGIPFDLSYRYSPPQMEHSGSRLSLSINNQFIKAVNLTQAGETIHDNRIRIPMLGDSDENIESRLRIPAFQVDNENELKFEFGFSNAVAGSSICQTSNPNKQYAAIDGNSQLDFTGYPHYIKLPNMRTFAYSGFPFTRMADLSDTVAILPKNPQAEEIEVFINMMGKFGKDTGYPTTKIHLTHTWSKDMLQDKDILVVGTATNEKSIDAKLTPMMLLEKGYRLTQTPHKNLKEMPSISDGSLNEASKPANLVKLKATGDFAAITSYQSPFNKQRTVVNFLAETPSSYKLINQALNDSGKIDAIFGDVVTLNSKNVSSFNVGKSYYVGQLPVWKLVMYHFSKYPSLMILAVILLITLVAIVLWKILRTISHRRIEAGEDK